MRALPYILIILAGALSLAGAYYGASLNSVYAMVLYALPGLALLIIIPISFDNETWQTYIRGRTYAKRMRAIRLGRRGF